MSNSYRPLSVAAKSQYDEGVVDLDLSVMAEKDALDGGHLEIVLRKYRVLSDNYTPGKQGEVIELALPKENEAALIAGSHIERYDEPAKEDKKPAAKAADKKEQ